jgi:hypothetical protein
MSIRSLKGARQLLESRNKLLIKFGSSLRWRDASRGPIKQSHRESLDRHRTGDCQCRFPCNRHESAGPAYPTGASPWYSVGNHLNQTVERT